MHVRAGLQSDAALRRSRVCTTPLLPRRRRQMMMDEVPALPATYFFLSAVTLNLKKMMSPSCTW